MASAALTSTSNNKSTALGEMLPADPFRSLLVHFGMLLGVEDFRTLDAYHRGKMWMHSAWLHREGTVWGLRVSLDNTVNEIRVSSGFAVDALGRELYLNADACLNLDRWYEEHKGDPEMAEIVETDEETGDVTFDAHVVIKFKACLARQVPALSEPCDDAGTTTAYSRVEETVELLLLPGLAPNWREPSGSLPYHRLRLLFGLEPPIEIDGVIVDEDQEVINARNEILARPVPEQPAAYLERFRYFSALDEMEMAPAKAPEGETFSLFPGTDPAPIPLADIAGLRLSKEESGWSVIAGEIDNSVRPVHVPTTTVQELLCGPLCQCAAASETGSGGEGEGGESDNESTDSGQTTQDSDAGGPRIDAASVEIEGEVIQFNVTGVLMKSSIEARSISVTSFDTRDGWITEEIKSVQYDSANNRVTVNLRDAPGGRLVRLIVKGTGKFPVLGRNRIPLAGAVGGPAGNEIDGNDFVSMFKTRS